MNARCIQSIAAALALGVVVLAGQSASAGTPPLKTLYAQMAQYTAELAKVEATILDLDGRIASQRRYIAALQTMEAGEGDDGGSFASELTQAIADLSDLLAQRDAAGATADALQAKIRIIRAQIAASQQKGKSAFSAPASAATRASK